MPIFSTKLSRLTHLFEVAGATDPQAWAKSEIDEGIPQEEPELSQVAWGLFEVDGEGNAGRSIRGLHESVLETDPTGREMCPKNAV
jgi:hypothetical protein